ncbi:phosphate-starvation-inducible protein PsiE [Kushneria phosphatilytica]|uniref:Protein PsiE n=1 Tax=Kushneria phosphatilytica TaxID=657387 RepID=A0A1S1P0J6_9GAMM|nr:phosphate-starvation-inducible PsiE family protein [Kushneria phosphatilytica]OHV12005.1 phosphate-starvation-inducible protein PsiE [Kushneria phosphatilytica]QEL11194.1 phosphate-starvation-inducible protein PsiE [Kushneria phosphatilytica]
MPKNDWSHRLHQRTDRIGKLLVGGFHFMALFAIGGAIAWGALFTFLDMLAEGVPGVDDILLLFIYLELGAMVGIYFRTNHMPVRFLIYVAITALTRMMIGDIQHSHHDPDMGIIYIAVSVLLLSISILIVRYGSARFPSHPERPPYTTDSGEKDDKVDER